MPVIGTAGHVDHGKSTLVHALTGRDPDRWEEEKRRGLTIDLGFGWTTLPGGTEVSFVDVPGHERFIKNMLAGIEAIDAALLVVAADEGWMPQSEEHLAVLDLLEVARGVVAITKIDRVDAETVELASLEVEDRLAGTSLEGSPIVPVSAPRGVGLEALEAALAAAVAPRSPPAGDRPRMWIDRSFSIAGAGTVVTGTLLGGSLRTGDRVAVWPGPREARVRSLQSHERDVDVAEPGRRVAVGLAGIEREDIERGSMLGKPDGWVPARSALATLWPARYVDELTDRGAYHLHIGSGGWPVRLRLDGDFATLRLPQPLCLEMGDRFVLRDTGRRLVVAGGRVLAPDAPRRLDPSARDELARVVDADPSERAGTLLRVHRRAGLSTLAAVTGGGTPADVFVAGGIALSAEEEQRLTGEISAAVDRFHREHALRPGLPLAELTGLLGISQEVLTGLAARAPGLAVEGAVVRAEGFRTERTDAHERAWREARRLLEAAKPGEVPRAGDLGLSTELIHALMREGELTRVSDDLVYLPWQVESLLDVMRSFPVPFTVSEFKDRAGISRKYAIPLLEWADRTGLTVRMGDRRRVVERE